MIRHGEAEGNVFRRLHGQYNSLLMPRAYRQIQCVKHRFENIRIDGCFSSDLTRAIQTAKSICEPKGLTLHTDPRFRELHVGVWEDLAYGYLDHFWPEDMHRFSHDPKAWRVYGAETYKDYTDRFIDGICEAAAQYDGGTIAVFCHGAVLRGTLMRLFFGDKPDGLPLSDNAGVSHLFYDKGCFTYEYLNDNSHIPQELSTFFVQSWWRKTDNRKEANLYFEPCKDVPAGLDRPPAEESSTLIAAFLRGRPIGLVSLGVQEESKGRVLGMTMQEQLLGRGYGDQLLGCAFSHFRRLGCDRLELADGVYPDDVDSRYGFDPMTRSRIIDPDKFHF